ncbi:MAG: glycosyltransferase [Acidimicrobiales bacterium]
METTAVFVAYGVDHLDLDEVPASVPIVVVHNDGCLLPATITRPDVIHVFAPGNVGFGAGANLALPHVRTRRVVFVNPDVELRPDHWRAVTDASADEVVTVPLTDGDGVPTVVACPYPGPVRLLLAAYRLGRFAPRSGLRGRVVARPFGSRPLRDAWISGAVLSVDAGRLRAVGGFDERYFLYFEDVNLCARLAERFPSMRARVAAVAPGVHGVGGAAVTPVDRHRVAGERVRSAKRYASDRPGWRWRLAAGLVRPGRRRAHGPATDLAIVRFGRDHSMGEKRRVDSWTRVAAEAGLITTEISLLAECRCRIPRLTQIVRVLRGRAVPEALQWSPRRLRGAVRATNARAAICVTTRTFAPALPADVVIADFVDRLSESYRHRGVISTTPWARVGYRLLAAAHARTEGHLRSAPLRRVAAGRTDAQALCADFVPVVVEPPAARTAEPDVDVVFVGSLDYPPNVDAVRELARRWPEILTARPPATLLLAGARPTAEVRRLASDMGWTLDADFADPAAVYARARVAVAPLRHTAGIQTKVLDAAAHGVAQVVYEPALAGLPEGCPAVVTTPSTFAGAVVDLLADDSRRRAFVDAGRTWAAAELAPAVWVGWLHDAVGSAASSRAAAPKARSASSAVSGTRETAVAALAHTVNR